MTRVKIEYHSKIELDEKMEINTCNSKEYIDLDYIEADADLSTDIDKKSEIVKNNGEEAAEVQTQNGNVKDETELHFC